MKYVNYNENTIIKLFQKVKKMSYSQFVDTLEEFGGQAYKMGIEEGQETGTLWTDQQIIDLLRSEHIGAERAARIAERMVDGRYEVSD